MVKIGLTARDPRRSSSANTSRAAPHLSRRWWVRKLANPSEGWERGRQGIAACVKIHGRWCYLYRAIDTSGSLVDVRLSETRDMAAARAFFRSAKAITGITPARVTTDGHDSYPRAIDTELGGHVRHQTNRYLNNRIEQDHRGIKGRYQPMLGFKSSLAAARFCRGYDELLYFLRPHLTSNQHVPANHRRLHVLSRSLTALSILQAA